YLLETSFLENLATKRQQAKRGAARFFKITHDDVGEDFVVDGGEIAEHDRPFDWKAVRNVHLEGGQDVLLIHSSRRGSASEFEVWHEIRHHDSIGGRYDMVRFINYDVVEVISFPLIKLPRHSLDCREHKARIWIVAIVLMQFRDGNVLAKDLAERLARLVENFSPMGKVKHVAVPGDSIR